MTTQVQQRRLVLLEEGQRELIFDLLMCALLRDPFGQCLECLDRHALFLQHLQLTHPHFLRVVNWLLSLLFVSSHEKMRSWVFVDVS